MSAKGLTLAPYTAEPMFVDDVRFSNAATVEHNVLGPGEVGHILRSRTTTVAGGAYAPTDAWFAFNQVGSVVNHSNAVGVMTQAVDMDAWGNTLASATSGAWGADQTGWKHSTKRLDPAAGVTYGFARWSDVRIGTWLSQEPTGEDGPNLYHCVLSNPNVVLDTDGLRGSLINPNRTPPRSSQGVGPRLPKGNYRPTGLSPYSNRPVPPRSITRDGVVYEYVRTERGGSRPGRPRPDDPGSIMPPSPYGIYCQSIAHLYAFLDEGNQGWEWIYRNASKDEIRVNGAPPIVPEIRSIPPGVYPIPYSGN